MARKRMIDPEIWSDEKVLELSWAAVPFYIGLVSQADDEGRIRYSASSLRAKICPRDGITNAQVEAWMWECVAVGLVLVYESDGVIFAALPGWPDYQKVQHPSPSRIPEPPSNVREQSSKILESSRILTNPHESSPQVRLDRLGKLGEVGGAKSRRRPQVTEADLPRFADLEADVVAYVAIAAAENKTGSLSLGRELTLRRELAALLESLGNRASFAHGLREANAHAAPNKTYVRKCAEKHSAPRVVSMIPPASRLKVITKADIEAMR